MNRLAALRITLLFALLVALAACVTVDPPTTPNLVSTRQPVPTPSADPIGNQIDAVVASAGLADDTVLGVSVDTWVDIGISILLILAAYMLVNWLLNFIFSRLGRVLSAEQVTLLKTRLRRPIRWLAFSSVVYFAIYRQTSLPIWLRQLVLDAAFVAFLVSITVLLWVLLDIVADYYRSLHPDPRQRVEIEPALTLLVRLGRILLITISVSAMLNHFGINVTALTAAVGIAVLALALAARDSIADAIAGVIILFDKPFRVGDRIQTNEMESWGDVETIGLRTTRIRTRDNRMVIMPNSLINSNQIVNYSYPDPSYRVETLVSVIYGSDVEQVREVLTAAARSVAGVLPDKPVDVLYKELGDSGMVFRVRWWINSYEETADVEDRVITALQAAITAHDIKLAYPTQTIILSDNDHRPQSSDDVEKPGVPVSE